MNSDLPPAIVSPPAEIRGVPQAAGKDNRKNPFNQNQQEQPSLGGFLVNSNPTVSGTNNGTTVGQSQNYTYFKYLCQRIACKVPLFYKLYYV